VVADLADEVWTGDICDYVQLSAAERAECLDFRHCRARAGVGTIGGVGQNFINGGHHVSLAGALALDEIAGPGDGAAARGLPCALARAALIFFSPVGMGTFRFEPGMDSTTPRAYHFAGFRVDLVRRRVVGPDGSALALPSRAYDVLIHLIENHGVFAPSSPMRRAIVPTSANARRRRKLKDSAAVPATRQCSPTEPHNDCNDPPAAPLTWAQRLKRVFVRSHRDRHR